jgi:hypothetical protein
VVIDRPPVKEQRPERGPVVLPVSAVMVRLSAAGPEFVPGGPERAMVIRALKGLRFPRIDG